ncbi:MAG: MEDS domain-containing protein [Candidatus Omnitrophota bacterium]
MLKKNISFANLRKTGLNLLKEVPWGTHLCQFYRTKEDLIEILVPYFKAGLENNELCLWVACDPLGIDEIKSVLREQMKNLDDYEKKGQLEIISSEKWYGKLREISSKNILQGWKDLETLALNLGFEGIRVTGSALCFEKKYWKELFDYEVAAGPVIFTCKMIAVCTYFLDDCSAADVVKTVCNHQVTLIKEKDVWTFVQSAAYQKSEKIKRESQEKYKLFTENLREVIYSADPSGLSMKYVNKAIENLLGYTAKEWIDDDNLWEKSIYPEDRPKIFAEIKNARKNLKNGTIEYRVVQKNGRIRWVADHYMWQKDPESGAVLLNGIMYDITSSKKTENELRENLKALEAFHDFAVNRELKMAELEKKVKTLTAKLKQRI